MSQYHGGGIKNKGCKHRWSINSGGIMESHSDLLFSVLSKRNMGTTMSIKHRGTYDKTKAPRGQRHMSCAVVGEKHSEFATHKKRIPNSQSFNQAFNSGHTKGSGKLHSISSGGSSGSNSTYDVTEKDFVQKVQSYLHSIEQLGEISDIRCFFGNLTLKTEDESFNVEVKGTGTVGESIVTLESEPNHSNTFMVYQYSTHFTNPRYFSLLYITDVESSDSTYYVLQANTSNPSGVPNFIPRRIKTSDNPKLVSPSSRFVGIFDEDGLDDSTNILFYNRDQEPFYLTQSDLSLDFTTDEFRAGKFYMNNLSCFEKRI